MNTEIWEPTNGRKLHLLEQHSFSDEAAQLLTATNHIAYEDNIEAVWQAVENGGYGLIPFENSSDGIVQSHFERLLHGTMHIVAEVNLHVRMDIGGLFGAQLQNAATVYSHSKGLGQCKARLSELGIKNRITSDSTAKAARTVRALNDPKIICLSSRKAIEAAGLEVLESDVALNKNGANITQFYVVENNGSVHAADVQKPYHAAVIQPSSNHPGIQNRILNIIQTGRVNLTSIQTQTTASGEYQFFMEMESTDLNAFNLMQQILQHCNSTKAVTWLGSWEHKIMSGSAIVDINLTDILEENGRKIDATKQLHGVEIILNDFPGALCEVTGIIRSADINLVQNDSRTIGHKQYIFKIGIDTSATKTVLIPVVMEQLKQSRAVKAMRITGSFDSIDDLHNSF